MIQLEKGLFYHLYMVEYSTYLGPGYILYIVARGKLWMKKSAYICDQCTEVRST